MAEKREAEEKKGCVVRGSQGRRGGCYSKGAAKGHFGMNSAGAGHSIPRAAAPPSLGTSTDFTAALGGVVAQGMGLPSLILIRVFLSSCRL